MAAQLTGEARLELDLDIRLKDLWVKASTVEDWNEETVGAFMRAAYGIGYTDALVEAVRGMLCLDHGFSVPDTPSGTLIPIRSRPRLDRRLATVAVLAGSAAFLLAFGR
jgi:hypothetical protein